MEAKKPGKLSAQKTRNQMTEKEPIENPSLSLLAKYIEWQASRETNDLWENQYKKIVEKLTIEMFNKWDWLNETRRAFIEHQLPLQREIVVARVVSATSLSAVKEQNQ